MSFASDTSHSVKGPVSSCISQGKPWEALVLHWYRVKTWQSLYDGYSQLLSGNIGSCLLGKADPFLLHGANGSQVYWSFFVECLAKLVSTYTSEEATESSSFLSVW